MCTAGVAVFGASLSPLVNFRSTPSSPSSPACKKKRSWSRAVFSNLQRKGLEKRFEVQKYVTKPDRRQLAAMLGLTDAQVSRKCVTCPPPCSHDAVGNSLRQTFHTHCASVHQAAELVAALLRVAGVTADLAESNCSLPPGL